MTFIDVIKAGSFSKAAREAYISPVAVMKQVNAFEQALGITLLNRTNHGVTPTPAGTVLYEALLRLLRDADDALARTRRIGGDEQAVIRVGTSLLRPCRGFIDLWTRIGGDLPFRIQVVPFEDKPERLAATIAEMGTDIDCFVGSCDSAVWNRTCSVYQLDLVDCEVAMPRGHALAARDHLTWGDLGGQELMLVRRGSSPVLDRLREDIERNHSDVRIVDVPNFYDIEVFNECERRGCLMETLSIWHDVHPGMVTRPVDWGYRMPYGIVYAAEPSPAVAAFIEALSERL